MRKFLVAFFAMVVLVVACFGHIGLVHAQNNNPCGGTNGHGQIINIEEESFTIELNRDGKTQKKGSNLRVNFTDKTTARNSNGPLSLTDLKIGDTVVLVGSPVGDDSFNADAVVVCGIVQQNGKVLKNRIMVRNGSNGEYEKVSGKINTLTILFFALVWLGTTVFLLLRKKKNLTYILFFTVFYVYLFKVLDYTLLQFQSLLLLRHFVPDLMLNGVPPGKSVNLIPLFTLTFKDVNTSFLNILMMMPFGFGLPFITDLRFNKVVIYGFLFSVAIEFLQLVTGFMANTTFRIADINDLVFNTLGVAIGYILFVGFVRNLSLMFRNGKKSISPILRYIFERPQVDRYQ